MIGGGTLQVSNSNQLGTGSQLTFSSTANPILSITGTTSFPQNITFSVDGFIDVAASEIATLVGQYTANAGGLGALTASGPGTLVLASTTPNFNSYAGLTSITGGGTLSVNQEEQFGSSTGISISTVADGTLALTQTNTFTIPVSLAVNGNISVPDSITATLTGQITETAAGKSLTMTGPGTLVLASSTANIYTGTTTINNSGTLSINDLSQLGGSTGLIFGIGGNTLHYTGSSGFTFSSPITLESLGIIVVDNNMTTTLEWTDHRRLPGTKWKWGVCVIKWFKQLRRNNPCRWGGYKSPSLINLAVPRLTLQTPKEERLM